jgi:recombination associated protein RdgC
MFKSALIYRIGPWAKPELADLEQRLAAARFVACGASQPESVGWVPPRGDKHAALAESVGGHWILDLCTETKPVPSSVVKTELEARLDKIEQDTGRRPKGKAAKEMKEQILHELLPRAFPKRSRTPIWIDARNGFVLVGATGSKKADAIVTRLVELLGGQVPLQLLQTEMSPARAMALWLTEQDAPAGFTIDRECELKQPDSEKAAVRYTRHTLEIEQVAEHIKEGKLPTQLALTYEGRVSFVLTEAGALKKIKLLDVVLEAAEKSAGGKDEGGFDADVALTTGELGQMLPALIGALGGELDPGKPPVVADEAAPAAAAKPAPSSVAPWDEIPA